MSRVVEAVYEKGVLRPLEKLDLREGEHVRIRIEELDLEELFGVLRPKRAPVKSDEEAFYEYVSERAGIP